MGHVPHSDYDRVYHAGCPLGYVDRGTAHLGDAGSEDEGPVLAPMTWLPRLFGLCVTDADSAGPDDVLDPYDVVAWGLEFDDEAITYEGDPACRGRGFGVFASAERALASYGRRYESLRLVYL